MAEPDDMIVPMLREMRADIAALHTRVDHGFNENDKAHKSFPQALAGDSLSGRLLTGEFEERIEKLEKYGDRIESWKTKFVHSRAVRD